MPGRYRFTVQGARIEIDRTSDWLLAIERAVASTKLLSPCKRIDGTITCVESWKIAELFAWLRECAGLEFRVLTRVHERLLHAAARVKFRRWNSWRFVEIDVTDVAWRGVDFSKKTWLKSWQRERGKGNLNVTKVHETRKEFVKVHLLIIVGGFSWRRIVFCETKSKKLFFSFLKMDIIPYLESLDYTFIPVSDSQVFF